MSPTAPSSTAVLQAAPPLAARLASVKSSVVRDLLALTQRPGVISFAGGLPAPELFDLEGARASFDAVLRSGPQVLQYSPTEGNPTLRELIARRYVDRGLPTTAEDIIVTTGSQQGLSLLATALVDPGDVVLVERPSYLAALQCFTLAGARLVAAPSNDDGIDPEALAALAAEHRPKALYTVPTFHNPTGRTLDAANREAIVGVAERFGFRVIEDDPYAELRYSGDPVPSMATMTDHDHVVATGSFSKILAPGLRLGWIRTRPSVRAALVVAKQAADLHTSTLDQAAAVHYLQTGRLVASVERSRTAYRDRRDALLAALPTALPAGSRWNRPDGGMFVWVELPGGLHAASVLPRALARDVAFVPGAPFYPDAPETNTLRLSFTTYGPDAIAEGGRRLAAAFAAV
jgi:2-aminoadipate transaminase